VSFEIPTQFPSTIVSHAWTIQKVPPREREAEGTGVSIKVRRFAPEHLGAIARLNQRFAEKGVSDRVYPESDTTPAESRGDPVTQELYVAIDDSDEVRGGVWLHEHSFAHAGTLINAGWLKYPVAESLIDREFGGVPGAMIVSVLRHQHLLMALGMGGRTMPLAQLLSVLGWTLIDVPFYVAAVRPASTLRHLPSGRSLLMRALSYSGIATAACAPLNALRAATSALQLRGISVTPVPEFGDWANRLWEESLPDYGFIARRDAHKLNSFYSTDYWRLTRLRIQRRGSDIGWVCVSFPRVGGANADQGDTLRIGMIADGLARPSEASAILAAATRYLVEQGMHLIVTNQLHTAWRTPLLSLGFVRRKTNFVFACSKPMAAKLASQIDAGDLYLNRGDCDGPPR
jgi:hypothetical protein